VWCDANWASCIDLAEAPGLVTVSARRHDRQFVSTHLRLWNCRGRQSGARARTSLWEM